MKDYLTNFPFAKLSIYATVIVIFTYNVLLERDFACTCKPNTTECSLHMGLPFFIIFVLILWMDRKFQRTWRFTCTCRCSASQPVRLCEQRRCGTFSLVLLRHVMKALLVGLLWVSSVLIDGHWYICCKHDRSEKQAQLACKDKTEITGEEQTIIAGLKSFSKITGFFMLFCIIVLAALMSLFGWRKCCEGKSSCCDRKVFYDKLILEEEGDVLEEILRMAAKQQLKAGILEEIQKCEEWSSCFDVAERLINNSRPEAPLASTDHQDGISTTTTTTGAAAAAAGASSAGATAHADENFTDEGNELQTAKEFFQLHPWEDFMGLPGESDPLAVRLNEDC